MQLYALHASKELCYGQAMDLRAQLNIRPEGRIILTQELRRALEILQMPQLELATFLSEEIDKNPLLECVSERGPSSKFLRKGPEAVALPSLYEHLLAQIREAWPRPFQQQVALEFMENLDERGFLTVSLDAIAEKFHLSVMDVASMLYTLQTFDPPGIFARTIQETFLLQLTNQNQSKSLPFRMIQEAFDDLMHSRYGLIKKNLQISSEELRNALSKLARLCPRPASAFQLSYAPSIYPDLKITRIDHKWIVEPINDFLPAVRLNPDYLHLARLSNAEKDTVRSFTTSAKWLIRSIDRRRKLILSIGAYLVRKQSAFFNGKGALTPITAQELASVLNVHESTISRAISEKYLASPSGLLALKTLVTSSNEKAKEFLRHLIAQEDSKNPLTDTQIVKAMTQADCKIARRTVTKYRNQLNIHSSSVRKHLR